MLWRIWPPRGFGGSEMKRIARALWHAIFMLWQHALYDDEAPIIGLGAFTFFGFGMILLQGGNSFESQSLRVLASLTTETSATLIAFALCAVGVVAIPAKHSWPRVVVSMLYVLAFLFLGITFYLTSPFSTGSVNLFTAAAMFWAFLRSMHE